jgi:hypothetical protein
MGSGGSAGAVEKYPMMRPSLHWILDQKRKRQFVWLCYIKLIVKVMMVVVLLRGFEKEEPLESSTLANGFRQNTDSLGGR